LDTYTETLKAWRVLVSFQDEGHVRAIGLSNTYDTSILSRLGKDSGRAVQVVQNRWYERNGWDRRVVEWCRKSGAQYQWVAGFLSFSPGHNVIIILQIVLDVDGFAEFTCTSGHGCHCKGE
jgi:diketogulonate reductase-like aldo/keto reductase